MATDPREQLAAQPNTDGDLEDLRIHALYMLKQVYKTGEARLLWTRYRAALDELIERRAQALRDAARAETLKSELQLKAEIARLREVLSAIELALARDVYLVENAGLFLTPREWAGRIAAAALCPTTEPP